MDSFVYCSDLLAKLDNLAKHIQNASIVINDMMLDAGSSRHANILQKCIDLDGSHFENRDSNIVQIPPI